MNIYQGLLYCLSEGKSAAMVTTFGAKNGDELNKCFYADGQTEYSGVPHLPAKEVIRLVHTSLDRGTVNIVSDAERVTVVEPFYPEPNLVILGGGHIARPLCRFAAAAGFVVTVIDDRPVFASRERFPDAGRIICDTFASGIESVKFTPYTYAVIVTRGHRHDLDCLQAILPKPWAYAGMIGSKRRVDGILKQLREEGFPAEVVAKVNTPIGLEIGAVTPAEIAVSILAELISCRRLENPRLGKDSAKITRTEFDREVLAELARGSNDKKAVITVIATKGSVPRKAGAKMLVRPDGTILGSIGGGCGESEVIREARTMLDKGGCKLLTVDLTGDAAEDMGMVCGGIMQVLIEPWPLNVLPSG